ncbi:histidine phosphatase family protein [Flavobacterium sp.]|uniref:SixA phosphatase family protein n=1 Tax=Flavobacterium sp. TaxID=239 RepID=UPI00262D53F0|nr:histidine phosphatase family protein [Flavobacterium sp.]
MKNLIIVRHAKAEQDSTAADMERKLTLEGVRGAARVAEHLMGKLPKKLHVFSSTASRTAGTANIFSITYPKGVEAEPMDALYTFDEDRFESIVRELPDSYENVMLFGHNDAITGFVNKFGNVPIDNVPTAGLVWIKFDTDSWQDIRKGTTEKIVFPRDLK